MNRMNFTQAVARLRVLETRLLNKVKLERMIDSSSAEETLKVLQETEYSGLMSEVKRAEDYEVLLNGELKRVYSLMYEVSPEKSIVDIMSVKYDYHNMKVLLKGKALNKDLHFMLSPIGTIDTEKLSIYVNTFELKELPEVMREAILEAYKAFKDSKDPQQIDVILDIYMYKDMLQRAEKTEIDYIINFVKLSIDFINLKTVMRLKKQQKDIRFLKDVILRGGNIKEDTLVKALEEPIENLPSKFSTAKYSEILRKAIEEYSKTGKFNAFEKLSEDFIMEESKKAKYVNFGPEPIFAYILAKETEIKVLRIIMVGKINNISPEVIRERLRDIYV